MALMKIRLNLVVRFGLIMLSLAPLALFAYLGQFSRLMSDDYCAVALGQELGAWGGMRYWYMNWAGSYANFFLKSAIAPLDTLLPVVTPVLIVILWWLAATFVLAYTLRQLCSTSFRRILAILLAGVAVAASLNAMYSPQSFYWFAASTHYTLPLALLTGFLGLPLWIAPQQSRAVFVASAVLGAALCFVIGGASEIFVVFQLSFMTLCLLPMLPCLRKEHLRRPAVVMALGWLATLAAFLAQLVSPGLANRAAVDAAQFGFALRDPTELIVRTLESTLEYIGHPPSFAGFVMLFAASLLTTLQFGESKLVKSQPRIKKRVLALGLVFQLVWIPVLWAHVSDGPQFLARFSGGYLVVVIINALLIFGLVLFTMQRDRVSNLFRANANSQVTLSAAVLAIALVLFALTQLRSIHFRAAAYLFGSAVSLLVMLAANWVTANGGKTLRRLNWLSQYSLIVAIACLATIVFAALFGRGFVDERILAPASWLLVLPGLFFGAHFGLALKQALPPDGEELASVRFIKTGCAIVIVIISVDITLGQLHLLPDFQSYARDWDARHQQILEQRGSGERDILVAPLSFDLAEHIGVVPLGQDPANRCARRYYDVDSIVVLDE